MLNCDSPLISWMIFLFDAGRLELVKKFGVRNFYKLSIKFEKKKIYLN